jgi:hypothetical protein
MPRIGLLLISVLTGCVLVGCRKPEPVDFQTWSPVKDQSRMSLDSPFGKLVIAGEALDDAAVAIAPRNKKGLKTNPLTVRVSFFPEQKRDARNLMAPFRSKVLTLVNQGVTIDYSPIGLAPSPRYLHGLRLIGLSLIWDIDEAIKAGKPENAIKGCTMATKFGAILMNGAAYEATLGAYLVDQARLKMIPLLPSLGAGQLSSLASGMQRAFQPRPNLAKTVANEGANMLLGIQQVQDAYTGKKLDDLQKTLGTSTKETLNSLRALQEKPEKAKSVFDWVGNDIRAKIAWTTKKEASPRDAGAPPTLETRSNWKMLHRYLATNLDNLLPQLQATCARTQLFIIECYLRQRVKMDQLLPKNLNSFSASARRDPFTGEDFFYHAGPKEFLLYSAGEDGIDNGGETDTTFKSPDMKIEVKN